MTTKNDITGASLRSKPPTQKYSDGWERIFGNATREAALDELVAESQRLGLYEDNMEKSDKKKKNKSDPKNT